MRWFNFCKTRSSIFMRTRLSNVKSSFGFSSLQILWNNSFFQQWMVKLASSDFSRSAYKVSLRYIWMSKSLKNCFLSKVLTNRLLSSQRDLYAEKTFFSSSEVNDSSISRIKHSFLIRSGFTGYFHLKNSPVSEWMTKPSSNRDFNFSRSMYLDFVRMLTNFSGGYIGTRSMLQSVKKRRFVWLMRERK